MRISDWSSDVCSSDLILVRRKLVRGDIVEARDDGHALAQRVLRAHCGAAFLGKLHPHHLRRDQRHRGIDHDLALDEWPDLFERRFLLLDGHVHYLALPRLPPIRIALSLLPYSLFIPLLLLLSSFFFLFFLSFFFFFFSF